MCVGIWRFWLGRSLSQLPAAILKRHGSPIRGSMAKPKHVLSSPSGQRSRASLSSGTLWSLIPRLHRLHIRVPTRLVSSTYIPTIWYARLSDFAGRPLSVLPSMGPEDSRCSCMRDALTHVAGCHHYLILRAQYCCQLPYPCCRLLTGLDSEDWAPQLYGKAAV